MPVADKAKVMKRKEEMGHSYARNGDSHDDQSYVFDYDEDLRARVEDAMEQGYGDPKITKKKKEKKAARAKKRELEETYGKSQPNIELSPMASRSPKNRPSRKLNGSSMPNINFNQGHNSQNTTDMFINGSGSDESLDFRDLQQDDVPPQARRVSSKSSQQQMNKSKNLNRSGSDASLDLDDLKQDDISPQVRRVKRKVHQQQMNKSKNLNRSRGSGLEHSMSSNMNSPKRVIQMRDTDRALRGRGRERPLERQDSNRPSRPSSIRRVSTQRTQSGKSTKPQRSPSLTRQNASHHAAPRSESLDPSRIGRPRAQSYSMDNKRSPSLTRQNASHHAGPRSESLGPSRIGRPRALSFSMDNSNRPPPTRKPSMQRSRSQSMDRHSSRSLSSRSNSRASIHPTGTIVSRGRDSQTIVLVPITPDQAKQLSTKSIQFNNGRPYRNFQVAKKFRMDEMETPPRSLLLIWIVVSAELAFDLATTIIAFQALIGKDDCCGSRIELGPIPMTVTTPFFLLIVAELVFLFRAMLLTLWPTLMTGEKDVEHDEAQKKRSLCSRLFCCCVKWNAKFILRVLNFLVLLNPFFGCVIAWMLLYQSDQNEAFIVLGLEGGSILLHFLSIWLEGSVKTFCGFLFHCIALIPFIVSVALILIYLKQGGVCYLVKDKVFLFSGCEKCVETGLPPIDNVCQFANGTNYTLVDSNIFELEDVTHLDSLTDRTYQGTYCAVDYPEGPQDVNFCFFEY
jgi:hypothetical protein